MMRKSWITGGLIFVALFVLFQNCSSQKSPISFFATYSEAPAAGSGNGDFYDGKPDLGEYHRRLPGRVCGGEEGKPQGRLVVAAEGVRLFSLEPVACAEPGTDLNPAALEFSVYNRRLVGFREGVYVRADPASGAAPVVSSDLWPNNWAKKWPEVWCRRPDSSRLSGLDVVVENDSVQGTSRSRIIKGDLGSNGDLIVAESEPLQVTRSIDGHKVRYEASGYSLEVEAQAQADKSRGRLRTDAVDLEVDCRFAGALDPETSVFPAPVSFTIAGVTGGLDALADSFLVGDFIPTLNWRPFPGASVYKVEIIDSMANVICALDSIGQTLTSTQMAACRLQDGSSYQARVSASNIFGAKILALNSGYQFTVTRPADDSGVVAPVQIPGSVEFEKYDAGGEGVGYHDTSPGDSLGQNLRGDDVDVFGAVWGRGIGDIRPGEWLKITVNATVDGMYAVDVGFNSSEAGSDPAFHLEVDGVDVTGEIRPRVGTAPDEYPNERLPLVRLSRGVHIIRVVMDGSKFRLSHMTWSLAP